MALNCSVEKALELMGSKGGGTRTKQLISALSQFYWTSGSLWRITKYGPECPDRGIMKVVLSPTRSHWVLKWDDFVYDPSWGTFLYTHWMDSVCTHTKYKPTSYLKLRDKSYGSR